MKRSVSFALMTSTVIALVSVLRAAGADGAAPSQTNNVAGIVMRIYDGDTVMFKSEGAPSGRKARLYGIDAPEAEQPFGLTSRERLRELTFDRVLRFSFHGEDNYGRPLVTIWADGRDVNLEMIREGMAWHYDRFDSTPSYSAAHAEAKNHRRGLWIDDNPVMPEEFRTRTGKTSVPRRGTGKKAK